MIADQACQPQLVCGILGFLLAVTRASSVFQKSGLASVKAG